MTGKDLLKWGLVEGKQIGLAIEVIEQMPYTKKAKIKAQLKAVIKTPESYLKDPLWGKLAQELMPKENKEIALKEQPLPYQVYGVEGIEPGALNQMKIAAQLPVATGAALMPDAHQGYGLPIGGVLATENAVIPYAVGVDIGCRMCMTIYDLPVGWLESRRKELKRMLNLNTKFGLDHFKKPKDHEILGNPLFREIPFIQKLQDRAAQQIGSSGGGNHFVEFGLTQIDDPKNEWHIAPGQYLAVLSHSGSRGLGANIANHYTKLAMKQCPLPKEAKHLAWLDLHTELGQEYWLAMNLAGDYASACHHQIHERMAIGLRAAPLAMIENHHNFAWKEKDNKGKEVIVHRKGATPAGKGVLGIIPGSMTAPGFIVRGKGHPGSLNSASHGAGRAMSRTAAKKSLNPKEVKAHLAYHGVDVIGAGLDEAPMAYKDIHKVMSYQQDLVDILGTFYPKIVRMCEDKRYKEVD